MADPALQRLTVDGFFDWCARNDDTRWELIDGCPVAMVPASRRHMRVVSKLVRHIDQALDDKWPCASETGAGIVPPDRNNTFYEADLAVTCDPTDVGERCITPNPILIVEALSPSTKTKDFEKKLPDYKTIPSVREILLIDSTRMYADVYRRSGDDWDRIPLSDPDARLRLESVGLDIPLGEVYATLSIKPGPAAIRRQV